MKSMTKYQLEHFKNKVNRQFQPYIEEQELIVKQFRTEAVDHAVKGLAKKMGADKVLDRLKEAEKQLADARATARTFFEKKKPKDEELSYRLTKTYNDDLSVSYGQHTTEYNSGDDQEAAAIGIAYTMGSMSISGSYHSVDNIANTSTDDRTGYEVSVSFAF